MAVRLTKVASAEVHGTASPGKHQKLAELDVNRGAINYRRNDLMERPQPL
nr:hypothetical protein [Mycobacterium leprae]